MEMSVRRKGHRRHNARWRPLKSVLWDAFAIDVEKAEQLELEGVRDD